MPLHTVELAPRTPGGNRTLVLLHGYGADERDLLPLAHELDPALFVVSLQAPRSLARLGSPGRAWYDLGQDARGGISFDPAQVQEGRRAALAEIERIAAKRPRPLLLGFSQGAGMALDVLFTRPELVAGVLALSAVPPLVEPGDAAPPDALRGKPVFLAHGTDDPLLPFELGVATRAHLEAAGLDVTWRDYRMGHAVVPQELRDAAVWLRGLAV